MDTSISAEMKLPSPWFVHHWNISCPSQDLQTRKGSGIDIAMSRSYALIFARVLLALATIVVCYGRPPPTGEFPHHAELDTKGKVFLYWRYDDKSVTFELFCKTLGWVGFGFCSLVMYEHVLPMQYKIAVLEVLLSALNWNNVYSLKKRADFGVLSRRGAR